MFGSGSATSIVSNKEMNDIMKIIKSFEESGLLIKNVSKKIKNEGKEQKGGFLGMLLGILGTILLGNLLKSKGTIRAGRGTIKAGQYFWCSDPLTNFDIQKCYQNELKFFCVYSRNNLPKTKGRM